ncbi:MAG: nucleoside-triphosphatase [Oscillibacter sp.]
MKRHLLICGERGVGKSTLIHRLLEHSTREVGGFATKRLPVADENGFFRFTSIPHRRVRGERRNETANLAGTCDSRSSIRHPEVFDGLGAQLIKSHRAAASF